MRMSNIQLTPSQAKGVDIIIDWLMSKKHQILRVGGPAGTGKTFFISYLIDELLPRMDIQRDNIYVVSYTGQAVNMLIQRDIPARTIHSTFMKRTRVPLKDANGKAVKKDGIQLTTWGFKPLKSIPEHIKLIIIDESSFLPESLEKVISSYGVKILEIGDPIQLPPVSGSQCFHLRNLDHMLVEPMRQEKDSGILRLATQIRHYERVDTKSYPFFGDVLFIRRKSDILTSLKLNSPLLLGSDSIIVTNNRQRGIVTEFYRQKLLGITSILPRKGEKMICRKNNWNLCIDKFPLTNGTVGTVMDDVTPSDVSRKNKTYYMDFKPDIITCNDYYDGLECDLESLSYDYGTKKEFSPYSWMQEKNKFEYAHAITAHLAQGSQYDRVMFIDSPTRRGNEEYSMRLRYTAVTRAKKKLYYILPAFTDYL